MERWRRDPSFLLVHVAMPIIVGAAMYTLWRSTKLYVFTWYRWMGLTQPVLALRTYAHNMRHLVPGPILYSLPDAPP